jgi:hypothetical protein
VLMQLIDEKLLTPGAYALVAASSFELGGILRGRGITKLELYMAGFPIRRQEALCVVLPQACVRGPPHGWVDPLQGHDLHLARALRAADEAHAEPLYVSPRHSPICPLSLTEIHVT